MDFTVNIDRLHLANLLGEVMDKIIEFQKFWPSENYTKRSNSMVFGFEKLMDFAMDIYKLNLAKMVGKVMDKIMEYQIFCRSVQKNIIDAFSKYCTKLVSQYVQWKWLSKTQ